MQYTSHRNLFTLGLPAGSINPSGQHLLFDCRLSFTLGFGDKSILSLIGIKDVSLLETIAWINYFTFPAKTSLSFSRIRQENTSLQKKNLHVLKESANVQDENGKFGDKKW